MYRPHISSIDAVLVAHDIVYSAGDHRITASDYRTGEVLSTVARDSGGFVRLLDYEELLYCCSSNGSMRAYGLTHTGKGLQLTNTMWEHSKSVNDVICSTASQGPCALHGINAHVCFLLSASADRSAKVWNTSKMTCVRTIQSDA